MVLDGGDRLRRALAAFDFDAFVKRKGGRKEAPYSPSREYLITCPFPTCRSSRLRVNTEKRTWICWGCGETGDVLRFIEAFERCELDGAIEFVLKGYVGGDAKIATLESTIRPAHAPKPEIRALPPIPWPSGVELLTDPRMPAHARAWAYLTGRGLTHEQIIGWRLAYGRTGRCRERIVFPVWMDHAFVYYQARATWEAPPGTKEEQRAWVEKTGFRKSINPENVVGHATAGEVVFNYDRVTVESHVVVCEGPIDAIKVGPHAVALLGKAPVPTKLERLRRLRASRFTVYLDRGEEERRNAQIIAAELATHADVYICEPPEGYDAGALTPEQNAYIVNGAVRWTGKKLEGILKT